MSSENIYERMRRAIRARTRFAGAYTGLSEASSRAASRSAVATLVRWDTRRAGSSKSIAMGFAGWEPGLGGVRNHLQTIGRCSRHPVRILPGALAMKLTSREEYCAELWNRDVTGALGRFPVLHSHVDPPFIKACQTARSSNTRWVHTYHTLYFDEHSGGELEPWKLEINRALIDDARHADVRISVSPWLQRMLEEKYGIETVCVPNGVDVLLCEQAAGARFTQRTGLSGFVVYVGSLAEVKNPQLFIDLARECPHYTFVMIGKNLTLPVLEAHQQKPIPGNLIAIGPLPHDETLDAIAASAAMVMTSHIEGFPTALLEAMALGKPVVATDAAGCHDAIGDESTGVLFEPGSLAAAKAGLFEALERPELGANAARRVRTYFDWAVVIQQLDSIYDGLMLKQP